MGENLCSSKTGCGTCLYRGPFFVQELAAVDKGFSHTIEFAEKKQKAIDLLISKAKEVERIPVKDDFTEEQVMLVKDVLGPFPRAMETAGLKEVSERYKQKLARKKTRSRH